MTGAAAFVRDVDLLRVFLGAMICFAPAVFLAAMTPD